jgi:hypothetical protein
MQTFYYFCTIILKQSDYAEINLYDMLGISGSDHEERLKALLQKDLGNARETSEAIHRAVEDFVGGAEPSDDLTKMCIIMY